MFLASLETLVRTLLVALVAYAALVALLRISGKRTLAKWNAFDLIVTVALGSSLATVILSREVPAVQGVLAFAALIVFQLGVTWLSVRFGPVERVVKSRPAMILERGKLDEATMRRERVSLTEVRAAVRSSGFARIEDVGAMILETDGSISVIGDLGTGEPTALADVRGFELTS